LQVSNVLTGSGAAHADLRKGDGLIAAEGQTLPTGPNAETDAAQVLGPLLGKRDTLKMTIARGLGNQVLNVPITRACAFRVELGNADNVNSYADGQRVMLTRGMINFAQTDDAIAYVMAKDMAHNILGHATSQRSSATLGSIIDNLAMVQPDLSMLIGSAGVKAMPRASDAMADRLSIYLLARAGYNVDAAGAFWKRLASQYPATVLNGHTANHPATAYRLAAIDKAVAEVKSKQAGKQPLLP
jgi:predicted Zn-dependent protease